MRIKGIFQLAVFLLLSLGACTPKATPQAPDSLEGKSLEGKRTSGNGAFDSTGEYAFSAFFEDQSKFKIVGPSGSVEDAGTYRYKKTGPASAELTLTDTSGVRSGAELLVELKFTSSHNGAFQARALKGSPGEQTGTFELR